MSVRKLWSVLLFVVMGSLVGTANPLTVEAENLDLFPADWIQVVPIKLNTPPGNGEEADVYFPAPPDNVPSSFEDAFPVVAMLQGAFVDKIFYREFGAQLARFGFVVVIPNHLPFTDQNVILDVLAQMEAEDANPESPLFGIVDTTRTGLAGHSFGGAVGLFAIDGSCFPPFCFDPPFFLPDAVRAGAFYGTNTFNPFPPFQLFDVNTDGIPVALVQGSLDSIATPAEAQATFEILDGPRSLTIVEGANHYGITDVNNPPDALPDLVPPTISQSEAIQEVADVIGQFLRTHLSICVNANLLLEEAQRCTFLQLDGVKVDMTGGAGGVFGDVCIEQNGKLSMSGNQFVNGSLLLSPGTTFKQSGSTTVEVVVEDVDLSEEINAALMAAQDAAAQPCTQTFESLKTTQTIFGNGGLNVICVDKVEVSSDALITLSGGPNDSFIINVTGKFKINGSDNGGKIVVAGEVQPKDVLYNIIGMGATVAFSGGGGGENCCKARVDGTILAPERKIGLSPGLVNGQIIAGKDISISGGGSVRCPSVPTHLLP